MVTFEKNLRPTEKIARHPATVFEISSRRIILFKDFAYVRVVYFDIHRN